MKTYITSNRFACIISSISIPLILFFYAKAMNINSGASAFTSTLKSFGFGISMNMGLVTLITIGIISCIGYEYLLIQHYLTKIEKEIKEYKINTIVQVLERIDQFKISSLIKSMLKFHYYKITKTIDTQNSNLIQALSIFLFTKYKGEHLKKVLKSYQIDCTTSLLTKRKHLTKTLYNQNDETLLKIATKENIRLSLYEDDSSPKITTQKTNTMKAKKIFISHSIKDKNIVQETIQVLESIGVESDKIYCSSFEGYGTPLGENYLEFLKKELNDDILVLFILSNNFFDSNICLSEMGAVWVLSRNQIPIYIPPFKPEDVKGVFPTTQGFHIDKRHQINLLKERIEKEFKIDPINSVKWGLRLDRILKDINEHINTTKNENS